MDNPSTSIDVVPKLEMKLADIKTKMEIAMKILTATEKESTDEATNLRADHREKFHAYTGYFYPEEFKQRAVTFHKLQETCIETKQLVENIRKNLIRWYLERQTVPTPPRVKYCEIHNIDKISDKFTWKRVPNTSKAIFIENSKDLSDRIKYLQKMKEYRQAGYNVVYIGAKHTKHLIPRIAHKQRQDIILLAVSSKGIINILFTKVITPKILISFFEHKILPTLAKTCVFVLDEQVSVFECKDYLVPLTPKKDLSKYLEESGIPHDPNAHRAELYHLIKNIPEINDKYFTNTIKGFHHHHIKKPFMLSLDFYEAFWKLVKQKLNNVTYDIHEAITCITEEEYKEMEKAIIDAENTFLDDDLLMEEVIDKVMTKAKNEGVAPSEWGDWTSVCSVSEQVRESLVIN